MHDLSNVLAQAHTDELRAQATADRLRAVLACCHPTVLRRSATVVVHWLRKGQLGQGYSAC